MSAWSKWPSVRREGKFLYTRPDGVNLCNRVWVLYQTLFDSKWRIQLGKKVYPERYESAIDAMRAADAMITARTAGEKGEKS